MCDGNKITVTHFKTGRMLHELAIASLITTYTPLGVPVLSILFGNPPKGHIPAKFSPKSGRISEVANYHDAFRPIA